MQGVADRELPRVHEADDVAGIRDADGFALAAEKAIRAGRANRLAHPAVLDRHVFREPSRAHAHERDTIAMPRIHVRLDLEYEAGEPFLGRRDGAFMARTRLRRRGELDERPQERL